MTISKAFAVAAANTASGTGLTSGTFDSSSYTHLVVFTKHEGATTTITPSDNKSSTGWTSLTKQPNAVSDSWGQLHWVKIGSQGTGHTVTMTLGAAREYRTVAIWLVNATSDEIELVDETTAQAGSGETTINAGTLDNAGAASVVSFMGSAEYAGITHTQGSGWAEDFDGVSGNFTFGQSRGAETTASIAAVATCSGTNYWAACAACFKEVTSAGSGAGGGAGRLTGGILTHGSLIG